MNKRQTDFAEHYAATGNAAESARVAGYGDPPKQAGYQALTSSDVQQAVARRIAEAEVNTRLTPEYVLSALMEAVERGLETGNLPAVTAAARELGRHLQLFTDRLDVTDVTDRATKMADELGIPKDELIARTKALLEGDK